MNLVAGRPEDRRGVSPVVAVVILFGLVLFAATLVAVAGMSMIDALQTETSLDRAETSMQQVRTDLGELADSPDDRRTELSLGDFEDGQTSIADDGRFVFKINPDRTNSCRATMDIGTLEYERDGKTVGFQAGGVFRTDGANPSMVSQPDLTFDEVERGSTTVRSINFPATNVNPSESVTDGSSVEAHHNRSLSAERQAEMQKNLCLPAGENATISRVRSIEIRIEGNQYADAWYQYLDSEIGDEGTVRWDGDAVVATSPLGAPIRPEDFTIANPETFGALHSGSAFNPSNLNRVTFDGYNSQVAPYDDSGAYDRKTGKLVSSRDVTLNGNFDFYGDVFAGGSITTPGRGNSIDGEKHPDEDIASPTIIDDEIDATIDDVDANDQNGKTTLVDSGSLTLSDGESATLESGVYYLDSLTVPRNADLTLDTSDGDVVIAARNGVTVENGAAIEVVGPDSTQARIFSGGDVDVDGDVVVAGDRSYKNFWYAPSSETVTLNGDTFTGVVQAPGASVTISRGADVYGSLIGRFDGSIRDAAFHYDSTLEQLSGDGTSAVIENGQVTGPSDPELKSFDSRATVLGTEFSTTGYRSSLEPSLPIRSVSNDDGDLDSLSYWQRTSSRVSSSDATELRNPDAGGSLTHANSGDDLDRLSYGEYGESSINNRDDRECQTRGFFGCYSWEYRENVQFDGVSGDQVEIKATPEDGGDSLTVELYDSDGDRLARGQGTIAYTLTKDDTYRIRVSTTDEPTDYRLELRNRRPGPDAEPFFHEDVTFDAREDDTAEITVSSDETSPRVELIGPSGAKIAESEGGSSVTIEQSNLAEGQHTIRVSGSDPETSFDYDVSLKRTRIENPNTMRNLPIRIQLVTNPPNGSAEYQKPWPSPGLHARSYSDAGHADDVNHPAVPEVRSKNLNGLEPGTGFSVEMDYRIDFCSRTDSYAGTSRVDGGTEYFELGCGSPDRLDETIDYDPNSEQNQLKILTDGDEVPHVPPVRGQRGMKDMLGSRLNDDDTLNLDDGEFVIAFELDQKGASFEDAVNGRSGADYNDVVMLYEITGQNWSETGGGSTGPGESPLDDSEDYSYTVNIENNQIVIGSE